VRMLQDMKVELEKEKADDEAVFEKLDCWCKQNDKEKSQAIDQGNARMADLKAAMEGYAAKIEELREALAETRKKLRKDKQALDEATAIRMKESQAFHSEEKELMAVIQSCKEAVVVLSRQNPSLAQLQAVAQGLEAVKAVQLAKDTLGSDRTAALQAFVQQARGADAGRLRRAPFEAYSSQSGPIFGILKEMKNGFESDLADARKEEQRAKEEFDELKAAKQTELDTSKKHLQQLEQDDASFREKDAQAYEEINDVREEVEVDQTFLANLKKKCAQTDKEFEARTKSRMVELAAVEDTIVYLNSDEAYDNFEKTVNSASFLQLGAARAAPSGRAAAARQRAAQALRRTGNPKLALIAEAVQLDAFTKVKEAINKMIEELRVQQDEEVEHRDWCKTELAKNDRSMAEQEDKQASLEGQLADLKRTLGELTEEIKAKTEAVAEMQKEMKRASELREGQNGDFQQMVADQRITQAILRKALDRMREVYAFAQGDQPGGPHVQTSATHTDPGNGPARFSNYEKSAKGGKVVAMIEEVLADAKASEAEARADEQDAQAGYETFMKDSNAAITKYQRAIVNMSEEKAKAEQAFAMAKSDHKDTLAELESLHNRLGELHKTCDFVLQNFGARQKARAREMEALGTAKSIVSGME